MTTEKRKKQWREAQKRSRLKHKAKIEAIVQENESLRQRLEQAERLMVDCIQKAVSWDSSRGRYEVGS